MTVNVTELRPHPPAYLKRVQAGEEICIASHGRVIARLTPALDEAAHQRLPNLRGVLIIGDVLSPLT